MTDAYGWIEQSLQTIHRAGWSRSPQAIAGLPGAIVQMGGQSYLNFASNDYLGLAGDDRLIQARSRRRNSLAQVVRGLGYSQGIAHSTTNSNERSRL